MTKQYNPAELEPKWQTRWEKERVFKTPDTIESLGNKPKYYILDMFPYPSGAGLHVGHPEGYTATDILARYKRMRGFNVLHPMGWDAFGLPAERAAVRENIHPAIITKRNVDNFRIQIKRLGFSYDWDRELSTASVDYYRWTQWIFLKLYEKGLAYLAEVPVNWCAALGTVLANEEVKDGRYVETGDLVERRLMKQWMLKITAYAERLLEDLETLDWPENVKEMQKNWIGKSLGAKIEFFIDGKTDQSFSIFTTRPDTLFGATYCVLAPEHPLVEKITTREYVPAMHAYIQEAKNKSDFARSDAKEKNGVFTGSFAINPVNQKPIPIWVADYVVMTYGTGAIMAVPAHDERDHEFAQKYSIPIQEVVSGGKVSVQEKPHVEDGILINSSFINGLSVENAKRKMVDWLVEKKLGEERIEYRLRDWLFSRQRYWGEPFPIVHLEDGSVVPLPEDALPVELPAIDEYRPTSDGKPPLARAEKDWLKVKLPDGRIGTRETNTMPQWAGSCWYYLRFLDANNSEKAWEMKLEKYWMPVDLYVGGIEHAVLHLLYARFWHKVLYDCGLVTTKEPFQKLFNQGMILAYSYQNQAGKYFHPEEVKQEGSKYVHKTTGEELFSQVEKMSKSKLNVVNPEEVIDKYGADSLRLYEMFMGPLDQIKPWKTDGVDGVYRFLNRVWRLVMDEQTGNLSEKIVDELPATANEALWRALHKTIKKVGEDTEHLRFNTAISQMMIFVNEATAAEKISKDILRIFLQVLSPYAPHICEELWEKLGARTMIACEEWPVYEPSLCEENTLTIILMVNGKKRDEILVSKDIAESSMELEKTALQSQKILGFLDGKKPKKIIVVPGKLVNFVI